MPRIPDLTDEELTDEQRALLQIRDEVFGQPSSAVHRMVLRTPKVARWFTPFGLALQRGGTGSLLDERTKEMAVIKTSQLNECTFCTELNIGLGKSVGITDDQIEAIRGDDYESSPALSDRDKAVVRWAESVTLNNARRDKEGFERLKQFFDDNEIVELTWVSALFNMINRLNDALWLDVEDKHREGIKKPVSEDTLLEFVRRTLEYADRQRVETTSGATTP